MSESSINELKEQINILIDKVEKLSLLLNTSKVINSLTDLNTLLDNIVSIAIKVSNSDIGSLFLLDKKTQELYSISARELGELKEIRIPINKGIAGYVATTGQILNIKDAYNDPRFNKEVDIKSNYRTKTILCCPIINKQRELIGTLQVINKKDGNTYSKLDEELMEAFCQQVAIALDNHKLYEDLQKTFNSLIEALAVAIDAKHPLTAGHSKRVMEYSLKIAKEIELNAQEIENIRIAALLHDIGKIGIPDSVLCKPGKLTEEEYEIIKTHPQKTRDILDKIYFSDKQKDIPLIASTHHEKINGKGYPYNLKDQEIPLGGKIIAIADVFDALTSERDYRKPMTKQEALEIIKNEAGEHFDKDLANIFCKLIKESNHD